MLWYDARETGGATERLAFDVPLAARADDGVRFDEGYSVRKTDGTYNDLALDRTQQGDFLESLSDAVQQEGSSGQLSWAGEAYHALTIDVTDGMMPNVASPFGGVLRLNVSGDCYVDGGGEDYSCFEGFDCVLITGEGSLRFENTAGLECGGGMLPVPAVVVDGDVDVCCENFLAQPNEGCGLTVAVLNGTLRTDLLRWRNGDMLIAGGVMTARSISTFNPITVTCRDGVLLLDWPSDYEMTFVLSGGEAYLAGPLNEGTVVEAGAGILAAQDVSAAEIHGVSMDEVTPAMRRSAKAINFGIVYGISGFGLARNTGITRKEADRFIATYFERYPGVKAFMDECVRLGYERGYAETLFHRRRELFELSSANRNVRSFGERAAMNTPIPGTAADIIKIAMVRTAEALKREGLRAQLILQVHDELIVDAPREEAEQVGALLKREMENAVHMQVPLTAEVKTGRSWYETK